MMPIHTPAHPPVTELVIEPVIEPVTELVTAPVNAPVNASTATPVNAVTAIAAADSATACAHFAASFQFETDCADVHAALATGRPGFVLLDVRSPALYAQAHVPDAINLPVGKIVASKLRDYPADTLFVTYCAGPHCNGAARGALRLAQLGRPVKLMTGGVTGWLDEGYALTSPPATLV